jgi:hypothetical protein
MKSLPPPCQMFWLFGNLRGKPQNAAFSPALHHTFPAGGAGECSAVQVSRKILKTYHQGLLSTPVCVQSLVLNLKKEIVR